MILVFLQLKAKDESTYSIRNCCPLLVMIIDVF